jgi:hypothetical protein
MGLHAAVVETACRVAFFAAVMMFAKYVAAPCTTI